MGRMTGLSLSWTLVRVVNLLAGVLAEYKGFAPINKRYKWLLDTFMLWDVSNFRELLEPVLQRGVLEASPGAYQAYLAMDEMRRPKVFDSASGSFFLPQRP